MRIALDRIDARGVDVAVGGLALRLARADNLRGQLVDRDVNATADALALEAFSVALGDLLLQSATGLLLEGFSVATRSEPRLAVEASAAVATTQELIVTVDDVVVRAKARLEGVRLSVRGNEGSLEAEQVVLEDFALTIGGLTLASPRVSGQAVAISWGAGFRLGARTLSGASLSFLQEGVRVAANGIAVTDLVFHGNLSLDRATVEHADIDLVLPSSTGPSSSPLAFDWAVLDFLSGEIDVDVHVELTVPVLGTRKATHRLRVPIDDGIIDYRALERNLSNLENALLDFSVRDEGLALERVNPLFPVRGHGKPIVVWALSPEDRALAERDHVRLAVLPDYALAAPASKGTNEPSGLHLHRLDLLGILTRLSLANVETPLVGAVRPRHVELLELRGDLHSSGPGTLAADVTGLAVGIHDLGGISIELVTAAAIKPISLGFRALRPTELHLSVTQLALDTLASAQKTH